MVCRGSESGCPLTTGCLFYRAALKRDYAGGRKPQHSGCFKITSLWSRVDVYTCGKVDEKLLRESGCKLTPLYHAFSVLFAQYGYQLSLVAVFCHQTPKVQFSGMRKTSCELGDLLVVHVHTAREGAVTRNALLYQAKMSSNQPHRIGLLRVTSLRFTHLGRSSSTTALHP
jgi:hypothetical protein